MNWLCGCGSQGLKQMYVNSFDPWQQLHGDYSRSLKYTLLLFQCRHKAASVHEWNVDVDVYLHAVAGY